MAENNPQNLWQKVRDEIQGTIVDIREKGAAGTLRDAVLDVKDLALDAGNAIIQTARGGLQGPEWVLDDDGTVEVGEVAEITSLSNQEQKCTVRVLAMDTISRPRRAKVESVQDGTVFMVVLKTAGDDDADAHAVDADVGDCMLSHEATTVYQDYEDALDAANGAQPPGAAARSEPVAGRSPGAAPPALAALGAALSGAAAGAGEGAKGGAERVVETAKSLSKSLTKELQNTVEDFKEKGAVGALRDAALDAVDIVKDAGSAAAKGAHALIVGDGADAPPKQGEDGDKVEGGSVAPGTRGADEELID